MLTREIKRLQSLTNFSTAKQFWQAWEAMQKLTTAVQEISHAHTRRVSLSPQQRRLLSLALFGVGGSILLDTALFALFGYLTYASKVRLSPGRLYLLLAFGALAGWSWAGLWGSCCNGIATGASQHGSAARYEITVSSPGTRREHSMAACVTLHLSARPVSSRPIVAV